MFGVVEPVVAGLGVKEVELEPLVQPELVEVEIHSTSSVAEPRIDLAASAVVLRTYTAAEAAVVVLEDHIQNRQIRCQGWDLASGSVSGSELDLDRGHLEV